MGAPRAAAPTRAEALPLRTIASVWLPFASAYFLSYGLRNVNAVLAPELTAEFALSAADLGLLTSAYYIAFSLAQLPAGLLLDRYGARRVHSGLLLVAAVGCALHAVGTTFTGLALGRALVGLGVAVGLMSSVKAFAQWFPIARLPLATNLLLACGGVGAIVAAGPVGWALHYVSWRVVFGVASGLFVAASAFLHFATPDRREAGAQDSFAQLARGLATVFASGMFWRLALMMAVVSGTYMAVQGLWIGPWLRDVGSLPRGEAIVMMTWFALAATAGFVLIGSACDWLIRRGVKPLALYKIQTGASVVSFALITFGGGAMGLPLWFAYFTIGSGGALVLSIFAKTFAPQFAGRVNTATNVTMFLLSFAFQWGVGMVLDRWPVVDGRYAAAGYQAAFGVLLAAQVLIYAVLLTWEAPSAAEKPAPVAGALGERKP